MFRALLISAALAGAPAAAMRVDDVAPPSAESPPLGPQIARQSLRELMAKEDPYFRERMRITNRVMMDEMIPLIRRLEPDIREGVAAAYARRFTAEQLAELNAFFATPTGRAFASESMLIGMDPDILARIKKLGPEVVREMPRILEKVKAATAALPPPPEPAPMPRGR
jgi:hypothetical protein